MHPGIPRRFVVAVALAAVLVVAGVPASAAVNNAYTIHPLVADVSGEAQTTDPNLVNAWGLAAGPTTPWWVVDNETDKSSVYNASLGAPALLTVNVAGGPTGTVFHDATADPSNFVLPIGGAARFIFASEDGVLRGWNPGGGGTAQMPAQDSVADASYKGLAIGETASGPRLYAADFHNAKVNVFDGSWHLVASPGFTDPGLPEGYAPFGIQTIGSKVFVAYAKKDEEEEDEEQAGQGLGFVDAYDTSGNLLGRVAQHGQLNAPWGLALAPASFGRFGGDLLVGNFGDGQINAYREDGGSFEHAGELRDAHGKSLAIDGLWALQFGNNGAAGSRDTLFFTAGPAIAPAGGRAPPPPPSPHSSCSRARLSRSRSDWSLYGPIDTRRSVASSHS
jgi:uncharacterized protein (TIGR03118 family)